MRTYSSLRDISRKSLFIGAELVYAKDDVDYEID